MKMCVLGGGGGAVKDAHKFNECHIALYVIF